MSEAHVEVREESRGRALVKLEGALTAHANRR